MTEQLNDRDIADLTGILRQYNYYAADLSSGSVRRAERAAGLEKGSARKMHTNPSQFSKKDRDKFTSAVYGGPAAPRRKPRPRPVVVPTPSPSPPVVPDPPVSRRDPVGPIVEILRGKQLRYRTVARTKDALGVARDCDSILDKAGDFGESASNSDQAEAVRDAPRKMAKGSADINASLAAITGVDIGQLPQFKAQMLSGTTERVANVIASGPLICTFVESAHTLKDLWGAAKQHLQSHRVEKGAAELRPGTPTEASSVVARELRSGRNRKGKSAAIHAAQAGASVIDQGAVSSLVGSVAQFINKLVDMGDDFRRKNEANALLAAGRINTDKYYEAMHKHHVIACQVISGYSIAKLSAAGGNQRRIDYLKRRATQLINNSRWELSGGA